MEEEEENSRNRNYDRDIAEDLVDYGYDSDSEEEEEEEQREQESKQPNVQQPESGPENRQTRQESINPEEWVTSDQFNSIQTQLGLL